MGRTATGIDFVRSKYCFHVNSGKPTRVYWSPTDHQWCLDPTLKTRMACNVCNPKRRGKCS